jgi:catechol 2,3-dioxygenase-like lactoylglutathione lyase family enzyme
MIHHVGLEVGRADVDACLAFWSLLGWAPVPQPAGISDGAWVQRDGVQIHLQVRDEPIVPAVGHPALIDPNLDDTAERLATAGHEVLERTRYWGARRIFTRCPAGHRGEIMSAPPSSSAEEASHSG